MLQQEHRLRAEQVQLTFTAVLVFATDLEPAVDLLGGVGRVGPVVADADLFGQFVQTDPADPRHRTGEILPHEVAGESYCFETLCSRITSDGRDTHLAHHLEHTLAQSLQVVADRLRRGDAGQLAFTDEIFDGLESQIRVHCRSPEADEQRDVMHLARITGLDDETDPRTFLCADQMVMHGRRGEQRRDRRVVPVGLAVTDHQR